MSSAAAERVYGRHGGYRQLRAYQVAEMLYDYTCRFCERYIPPGDRHCDQMVQAARSGYQNLAEGSEDSATSRKLELNLTNVAKGSIDELQRDYQKHLERRGLRLWQAGEPLFEEARGLRPGTVEAAAAWVNGGGERNRPNGQNGPDGRGRGSAEERAANLGAILAAQAHWLVERLLDRQARDFEAEGGFAERLYRARSQSRGERRTDETDTTEGEGKRETAAGPGTASLSPRPFRPYVSVSPSVSSVPHLPTRPTGGPDQADMRIVSQHSGAPASLRAHIREYRSF
ncbi:MAG: hypothetical protein JXR77_04120 [Lentisphaeria bacterium]|nr:hypothetical protein [Lentisphaeria bacterium]